MVLQILYLATGILACISSMLSFAPTLILKKILEYVDNPRSAPASVAWFYVFCMFGCKLLVAVATGQALFFGRRVCIRMRSIIISEISRQGFKEGNHFLLLRLLILLPLKMVMMKIMTLANPRQILRRTVARTLKMKMIHKYYTMMRISTATRSPLDHPPNLVVSST